MMWSSLSKIPFSGETCRLTTLSIYPERIHQLEKIFDPFYRIDSAHAKATSGQGLGLSIVQWIMKLHNADIDVKSLKNGETMFTIKFVNQAI